MAENTEKFLVTDLVPPGCMEILEEMGYHVDHIEDLSMDELEQIIGEYTGIVIRTSLIMNKKMLDLGVNLKYILRPGSGLDNVDVPYAESKGIIILNSPEANSDAVGEHAIGLLLALLNYIPRSFEEVKQGMWRRTANTGTLIKGKTVGVIGYGNTGSAFAHKLLGFDATILVYDKYKKGFGEEGISEVDMERIYHEADIVSIHVPLTDETYHMINDVFLSKFHRPVYLINTARGKVADTRAIINGLKSGRLPGVALDVLEKEKLSEYDPYDQALLDELIQAGNVIITPHIAGWTHESRAGIFFGVLEKFKNLKEPSTHKQQ